MVLKFEFGFCFKISDFEFRILIFERYALAAMRYAEYEYDNL